MQILSLIHISINKNGSFCKDIMVYFKNSDKVVSSFGNMDFSMYCELYCFDEGETAARDRLKTHLSEYHFRDSIRMDSKWTGGRPALLLTMTNLKGDFGESSAMIGMWLDMEALNSSIELAAWESGLDLSLIHIFLQILPNRRAFLTYSAFRIIPEESALQKWPMPSGQEGPAARGRKWLIMCLKSLRQS